MKKSFDMLQIIHNTSVRRVAFIGQKGIPAAFPGTSGVESYVEDRALRLVASGLDVFCYVRRWATPGHIRRYRGIRLVHLPTIRTKHFDAVVHSFLASVHVCFTSADTVWYQASGPALFSFIPRFWGKRVILTVHTLEWKREKWGLAARFMLGLGERIGAISAHTVCAVSDDIAGYIAKKYRVACVIDSPVIARRSSPPPSAAIIRKRFGLVPKGYFLFLGRLVPEKRVEHIIDAFSSAGLSHAVLVIAGGSDYTSDYELQLKKTAGDKHGIRFVGWVFGKLKDEMIGNANAVILASSVEGNPWVFHEAASFGVPLIAPIHLRRSLKKHQGMDISYFRNTKELISIMRRLGK